jgi:hypothetical protein
MTTLFAIVATFFGTLLIAVPTTFMLVAKSEAKKEVGRLFREAGLGTKETVELYGRAVMIIRRLHGLTELDGELAVDMLSPESKRLVDQWIDDYRKAISEGKATAAAREAAK